MVAAELCMNHKDSRITVKTLQSFSFNFFGTLGGKRYKQDKMQSVFIVIHFSAL